MSKLLEYFKLGVLLNINQKLPYPKEDTYDDDKFLEDWENMKQEQDNYKLKLLEIHPK